MALRPVRRSGGKRYSYVSPDDSHSSGFSSSEDESVPNLKNRNKVRDSKSIKMLLKESNECIPGDDHAYSAQVLEKRPRKTYDSALAVKRARCVSKNAINARINRERKKAYVSSLEKEMRKLREENENYATEVKTKNEQLSRLKRETNQLKSLLANNRYLGTLVNKLSEVTGLPVSSSLLQAEKKDVKTVPEFGPRVRSVPFGDNHPISGKDVVLSTGTMTIPDYHSDASGDSLFPLLDDFDAAEMDTCNFLNSDYCYPSVPDTNVGICVHVNQNRLSVEFCSSCNSRAAFS